MSIHFASEKTLKDIKNELKNIDIDNLDLSKLDDIDTTLSSIDTKNDKLEDIDSKLENLSTKLKYDDDEVSATHPLPIDIKNNEVGLRVYATTNMPCLITNSASPVVSNDAEANQKLDDIKNKLDTLIEYAILSEQEMSIVYVPDSSNSAKFVTGGTIRLKSIIFGTADQTRNSLHVYDASSGATITSSTVPKFSLFCPSNEVAMKISEGFISFQHGIWIRAVKGPVHTGTETPSNNNGTTITYYTLD